MDRSAHYATWFGRVVWLGILVNLSFAIPALFTPAAFASSLDLRPAQPDTWLRNTGMLLVVLCLFYARVARDPFEYSGFARIAAVSRLMAAAFWLWMVWALGQPRVLWWFM